MRPIQLKVSDLATVSGYSRFRVAGLVKQVFKDFQFGSQLGSQRTFTPQELLIVAVVCEIEQKFSVERKTLALASQALQRVLSGPRIADRQARLVITFRPAEVSYLVPDALVAEGLVVRLGPVFEKVDEYLGVSGSQNSAQGLLPLRPAIATGRRGGGSRRR
jgi:hypothetical protein